MSELERNTGSGAPDEPLPRISSGIAGLDDVLCGGFVRNGIYIVQGLPGAGKTIFGNQICYTQAATGAAALYVTLLSETYDRMMLNIRRMRFFRPECIAHQLNYISAFRVLEEDGLHGLLNLLRREIVARRPSVLVIDGLLATEHIATSQLELKKFVHELQMQAATGDCTMFLLTSGQSATVSPEHTMVDGMIEFGDQQFGWRAEREILVRKFRGSGYLRGWHAARIDNDGISVFPRIESMFSRPIPNKPASFRRVSTGVAGLDEMLGGGLPEASTTLVLGPTGSGKTAFGLHFLAGSSDDAPGLMVGFYEAPGHLVARAELLALGLAAATRGGAVEMQWSPEAEGHMDEVALRLLDNVRRRGVRRVVIDGLLGFRNLTPYRDRLPSFIQCAMQRVAGAGRDGDVHDGGDRNGWQRGAGAGHLVDADRRESHPASLC